MNNAQPTYVYTTENAIEDGLYAPMLQRAWDKLTHGKPIYMTEGLFNQQFSEAAHMEIWNDFVRHVKAGKTIPTFKTKMNGQVIWAGDNGDSIVFLLPSEY